MALLQAVMFGGVIALLVYFRPPRGDDDFGGSPSIQRRVRDWLERLELVTYDWRARELGRSSSRPDEVVVVAIDDATLSSARKDEDAALAIHPWPRELLGSASERLISEGAKLVVLDFPFADLSPSACVRGCPEGPDPMADDRALRAALDRSPGRTLLTFAAAESVPRFGATPRPYLLYVDGHASAPEGRETVRRILAARRPAFIIPEGDRQMVYAGVASDQDAEAVSRELGLAGAPMVRELAPPERAYEVTALDLQVALAEVQVEGLDPSKLPRVRSLSHPVAPLLATRSAYGLARPAPDADGVLRAFPQLVRYSPRDGETHLLPSAPLAAAMRVAGTRSLRYLGGRLFVGDKFSIPMDENGYSLLRWDAPDGGREARGTLARDLSAWRVVMNAKDRERGIPPPFRNELDGRVVVFTDASSGSAAVSTPVGAAVPSGAVLGQAVANVLRSEGIERSAPRADAILSLAMAFVGALLALTFAGGIRSVSGGVLYALLLLLAAGGYVVLARMVFLDDRLWIPVAGPLLAMAATVLFTSSYAVRTERRIREFVHHVLGGAISPEVVRQVSRDLSLTRPEKRQATIAFCDIAGFTHLTERLSPERLAQLLNEFLTEMTEVVQSHGGHVEYSGDAMMAFWGAPVRTDRHAHLACESMLLMRDALARHQREWDQRYGERIDFRAGLASGEVVAGDMGSEHQSKYTVLGEVVNLASRLERSNRDFGTWILVGEGTARIASDAYVFREVERVRARGSPLPWTVFELFGRRADLAEDRRKLMPLHEQAMLAYHGRKFDQALALFEQARMEFKDPVAEVYVARCKRLIETPPPAEWDGVFEQRAA